MSKLKASNNRETFAWRLVAVRQPYMIETMMRAAEFERWDARARGFVPKDCPAQVADTYLAREGHWRLPTLLVTHDPEDAAAAGGPVIEIPIAEDPSLNSHATTMAKPIATPLPRRP